MLTNADIESMRQTQNEAMPDTATVERKIRSTNTIGEVVESWGVVGTWPCRVVRASTQAKPTQAGSIPNVVDEWVLTFPWDADVAEGDRATVDGNLFEIRDVVDVGAWRTAKRAKGVRV